MNRQYLQSLFTDLSAFQWAVSPSSPQDGTIFIWSVCYSQSSVCVQSTVTLFSQRYLNADKKRYLFRIIWQSASLPIHWWFFSSETNFSGYCGLPAALSFRSAKNNIWNNDICEMLSTDSCPRLQDEELSCFSHVASNSHLTFGCY